VKTCSTCRQPKSTDEYVKNPSNADGLHSQCKGCRRAHQTTDEYRARRRERRATDDIHRVHLQIKDAIRARQARIARNTARLKELYGLLPE
jgi:transposase-like protein